MNSFTSVVAASVIAAACLSSASAEGTCDIGVQSDNPTTNVCYPAFDNNQVSGSSSVIILKDNSAGRIYVGSWAVNHVSATVIDPVQSLDSGQTLMSHLGSVSEEQNVMIWCICGRPAILGTAPNWIYVCQDEPSCG